MPDVTGLLNNSALQSCLYTDLTLKCFKTDKNYQLFILKVKEKHEIRIRRVSSSDLFSCNYY